MFEGVFQIAVIEIEVEQLNFDVLLLATDAVLGRAPVQVDVAQVIFARLKRSKTPTMKNKR